MRPYFALRIDVETAVGLLRGLPGLLQDLEARGLRATVMVPMGPDRSGLAMARVLRSPRNVAQMLRLRPAGRSAISAFMAGILTPVRSMAHSAGKSLPVLVRHELGLHGHDHWLWIHRCRTWPLSRVALEIRRGRHAFTAAFGEVPSGFAAPGWIATSRTLEAVDRAGFRYASDCRGSSPFLPEGALTPQLPVTLPTAEETVRAGGSLRSFVARAATDATQCEYSCYCAHAEVEGMRFPGILPRLLDRVQKDADVGPLGGALRGRARLPVSPLALRRMPGRFDTIAWQGES